MVTREVLNQNKQQKIIEEQQRETRKKIVIFILKLIIVLITIFFLLYFYTTYSSTTSIIVKEKRIINEKIPSNFNGIKIIHFSDLHYGTTIFEKEVKKIVNLINERNPDLVLFTGDLIDQNYSLSSKKQEKLIAQLKKINANLGKYAIMGEEDEKNFTTIFNQSDFTILNNDYELIYKDNSQPILLIGLASLLQEKRDIDQGYRYFKEPTANKNIFTISLLHEPDSTNEIINHYPTDLILAGHSHKGTIRIPFLGEIKKIKGAQEYEQEYYNLKNSQLYISSGLGTNGPGFRLFCHPSINFFRLSNQ